MLVPLLTERELEEASLKTLLFMGKKMESVLAATLALSKVD